MTPSEVQPGEGQSDLRGTIAALEDELVAFCRDLHAHPELSHAETRTTARVADRLAAAGVRVRLLTGTGLVADLGADDPAYRVALRADLDALPLVERTGLPFTSRIEGSATPAAMTFTWRRSCWRDSRCTRTPTPLRQRGSVCV